MCLVFSLGFGDHMPAFLLPAFQPHSQAGPLPGGLSLQGLEGVDLWQGRPGPTPILSLAEWD